VAVGGALADADGLVPVPPPTTWRTVPPPKPCPRSRKAANPRNRAATNVPTAASIRRRFRPGVTATFVAAAPAPGNGKAVRVVASSAALDAGAIRQCSSAAVSRAATDVGSKRQRSRAAPSIVPNSVAVGRWDGSRASACAIAGSNAEPRVGATPETGSTGRALAATIAATLPAGRGSRPVRPTSTTFWWPAAGRAAGWSG